MGVSISGLVSNMDTDAIVAALVSGYTVKKESYEKAQTKLEWKQEAWKNLNTKIKNFYSNHLSNMRFSTAFNKKTSVVSGSQATVVASNDAVVGTQRLKVKQLATSGYLTGGMIAKADGGKVTEGTKMSELGIAADSKLNLKVNGKETTITLNADTTVGRLVTELKEAGVNASFDEKNQRFFVSSKTSGVAGDFQLMASNAGGSAALKSLGLAATTAKDLEGYKAIAAWDLQAEINKAYTKQETAKYVIDGTETGIAATKKLVDGLKADNTTALKEIDSLMGKDAEKKYSEMTADEKSAYKTTLAAKVTDLETGIETLRNDIQTLEQKDPSAMKEDDKANLETYKKNLEEQQKQLTAVEKQQALMTKIEENEAIIASVPADFDMSQVSDPENKFKKYVDGLNADIEASNNALKTRVTNEYTNKYNEANSYVKAQDLVQAYEVVHADNPDTTSQKYIDAQAYLSTLTGAGTDVATEYANAKALLGKDADPSKGATRIEGQDAIIELNGATFTSNTNTFQVNGLTITANAETAKKDMAGNIISDEEVTITTDTDTQGIYDMIKGFFKEYNSLINEMDKLYSAPTSKGYEPLSDDEKEAMSEDDIEKWEKKIKDSLLRRDSTLDSVINTMKNAMQTSVQMNGKTYNLSSFGIKTLSYFSAPENEKGAYHIDGDKDDVNTSGASDRLMAMIGTDPEAVAGYFNKLAANMYNTLSKKMQSSTLSSAFTIYNDKQMKTEQNEYKKLISQWEDKIETYEDRYRKQFAAMESALASLNAQQSQMGGLFSA